MVCSLTKKLHTDVDVDLVISVLFVCVKKEVEISDH